VFDLLDFSEQARPPRPLRSHLKFGATLPLLASNPSESGSVNNFKATTIHCRRSSITPLKLVLLNSAPSMNPLPRVVTTFVGSWSPIGGPTLSVSAIDFCCTHCAWVLRELPHHTLDHYHHTYIFFPCSNTSKLFNMCKF